ncbi:methylmalonyl-CoA mutase small subunit [Spiractinospora alimapuensis]|uniref:methylmalonyl-CoA mutase family protein n=1 Tax=Spiractinospora alimapuensis TaxID=2820884 RepID=UPI001F2C0812|nr:methylmalonyl-CoA mutase family protein [Spiractinospora alimapuensis]QVQ50596.1 methylmalonyl-CoA mutase small subunit [Spiractinospora alimapuensis]
MSGNIPDNGGTAGETTPFPTATREEWRALVARVLTKSGKDTDELDAPEDLLTSTTYDGIRVHALYDRPGPDAGLPGSAPYTRGSTPAGTLPHGWEIRQLHRTPDADAAVAAIDEDLAGGVDGVWLRVGDGGLPVHQLPQVLDGLDLNRHAVTLDGTDPDAAAALLRAARDQDIADDVVFGNLGLDPFFGSADEDAATVLHRTARLAAEHGRSRPWLRTITVDASHVHDAGGTEAQELGVAVGAGVSALRALLGAGLDLATAANQMEFRFAASADQFLTIAKLRAARAMWARVAEVCGVPEHARGMRQHAVTSAAMMTRRDPYVNLLRTTVACFAAGVGGADAVTVRPFDDALGLPDRFSRRIARNTQLLLLRESDLARVLDPGGGSGYLEDLTLSLRDTGWGYFQEVERAGGAAAALDSGLISGWVDDAWERRRANLARRIDPLTGVSEFPDLAEPEIGREPAPATPPLRGGLTPRRYAEEFESLRDRSDAHLRATGKRPRVFLVTLGSLAAHNARASFVTNLLAAGGFEAVNPGPLADAASATAAFADSETTVVCLCAGDEDYERHASDTVRDLRARGASHVMIAGGSDLPPGVDTRLTRRSDVVAVLTELCDEVGVAP